LPRAEASEIELSDIDPHLSSYEAEQLSAPWRALLAKHTRDSKRGAPIAGAPMRPYAPGPPGPSEGGLCTPFNSSSPARTLVELGILQLEGAVRDRAGWSTKLRKPSVERHWRDELRRHPVLTQPFARGLETSMLEFALAELAYQARWLTLQAGPAAPYERATVDRVVQATPAAALRKRLQALTLRLGGQTVWHPGSKKQVRDLVHPSLYPVIYGRSVEHDGGLTLRPWAKETNEDTSDLYQWLPAEVDVAPSGATRFVSYINSLHPLEHPELYTTIAEVFQAALPAFEQVLGLITGEQRPRIETDGEWHDREVKLELSKNLIDEIRAYREKRKKGEHERHPVLEILAQLPYLDQDEYYENRKPRPLAIRPFVAREGKRRPLHGRQRVLVKLAETVLTPENSKFEGGHWHVEGMQNENIVASAVYYFGTENLTSSRLHFREAANPDELIYEQDDFAGVDAIYGLPQEGVATQELGSVETPEGRLLVFPNVLQHRLGPFELADPTRPGRRRILALFLIHPETQVYTSATVPPQRRDWYVTAFRLAGRPWAEMPSVLAEIMLDYLVYSSLTPAEALQHMKALSHERKFYIRGASRESFERPYSLCEH
jgi:hypothetical protein